MSAVETDTEALQESLVSMGFAKSDVEKALTRCANDVDLAISMLTSGRVNAEPDEFDMLAQFDGAEKADDGIGKNVKNRTATADDESNANILSTVGSVEEARINDLVAMGYDEIQAAAALKACGNDINAAIEQLSK